MAASGIRRYSIRLLCPICGGYDGAARHTGKRCYGYIAADGESCVCTREEHAGELERETKTNGYWHTLHGPCPCGVTHNPGMERAVNSEHRSRNGASYGKPDVRRYELRTFDNELVAIHCRMDLANGDKQIWYEQPNGTRGLGEIRRDDLPFYGTERINGLAKGDRLVLVEGEKCCDELRGVGQLAVGTATGASGTPTRERLKELVQYQNVLWPDNDDAGRAHMQRIGKLLIDLGCEDVRIVNWKDAPAKGDCADFISLHGGGDALEQLLDAAVSIVVEQSGVVAVGETYEWDTPLALVNRETGPAFPIDVLPKVMADAAKNIAQATQTTIDGPASMLLGVTAAACMQTFKIEIRLGWKEELVIPIVLVMDSGERKSAMLELARAPLDSYEREMNKAYLPEYDEYSTRLEVAKTRLNSLIRQRASNKATDEDIEEARERVVAMKPPKRPQIMITDATPEAIIALMAENGGKALMIGAEATMLEIISGRYSGGQVNQEFFLSGYTGEQMRVARKKDRTDVLLERPTVSMLLAIQPDALKTLDRHSSMDARGFLARILFSVPQSLVGTRSYYAPDLDPEIQKAYHDTVRRILTGTEFKNLPLILRPSDEAQAVMARFHDVVEPQLGPGGRMAEAGLKLFGAKDIGRCWRMTGALHIFDHASRNAAPLVAMEPAWVEPAVEVIRYYQQHTEVMLSKLRSTIDLQRAQAVLHWIAQHNVTRVSVRDVFKSVRRQKIFDNRAENVHRAFDMLVEFSHCRLVPQPARRGPVTPVYEINPLSLSTLSTEREF